MTVTSLSFTLITTYAPQRAQPATGAQSKAPPVHDDDAGCEHKRPASRQNRLADAMMSALRELGFGATAAAAAPAAGTPAASSAAAPATPSATATPATSEAASAAKASSSVESAVQQFAHALFQALRQSGNGKKDSDDDSGRVAGHGHHRHHHHHGQGHGYGNLSQRLEALSQTAGTPTPGATTAAAPASAAGTPAAASTTPVATPIVTPVAPVAKNPLLDAFTKLFETLKPANTGTAASTPATDMAEKLRQFLHTLAQALAPDTMGSVQRAQVGGLVDVSA
ncbi:MAG: hypothetical protein Q8R33_18035 [Burkholderiales bacterium]|nr:hypothetical protein [Burkholderiales bacterium]